MPFMHETNRISYEQDGRILAEVVFPAVPNRGAQAVNIEHTFVDEILRGQGVAEQLLERVAADLRQSGRKALLTCEYSKKWFARHAQDADVLL